MGTSMSTRLTPRARGPAIGPSAGLGSGVRGRLRARRVASPRPLSFPVAERDTSEPNTRQPSAIPLLRGPGELHAVGEIGIMQGLGMGRPDVIPLPNRMEPP